MSHIFNIYLVRSLVLLLYPLYLQTYCGFCYEVYIMIFITATSCLSKYMYMHLISTCTQEYNILYIQCIISSYIQVHCYLILYYHTLYCTLVFNSDSCYKCFNSIPVRRFQFHSIRTQIPFQLLCAGSVVNSTAILHHSTLQHKINYFNEF